MAFTVTSDHSRQEQVWESLARSYNREHYYIRRQLTEGAVRASDKRALFVGLAEYQAAGGVVLRNLFQQDDGGWLQDVAHIVFILNGKTLFYLLQRERANRIQKQVPAASLMRRGIMNTQIPISRRDLIVGFSGGVAVAALASANARASESSDDPNGGTKLLQFPADNDRLGHSIFGSGPEAVLVMHEWLGDHRNYSNVLPYLTVEKFTYVFADLRGYGLSKNLVGTYSAAEASSDAYVLMRALGHKTFHVAGHSMSGMIGQRMLLDDIGAIKSLTLTSPVPANGFKVDAKGMEALRSAIYDDAAAKAAINARTGQRYSNSWLDRKLWISRTSATPAAMEGYLAMFTGTDFSASVRGAKMRVGAIVGAFDVSAYRAENVTKTLTDLYGAVPVSVDNEAGHYSMLETPVLYASLLEKHLSAEV